MFRAVQDVGLCCFGKAFFDQDVFNDILDLFHRGNLILGNEIDDHGDQLIQFFLREAGLRSLSGLFNGLLDFVAVEVYDFAVAFANML